MIVRSEEERALIARAEAVLPTGTRAFTFDDELSFLVGRAEGSRLWDVSGNVYVDYLLGSGPHVLGHAHPAVLEALRTKAELGTSYLVVHEHAVRLAEKIVEHVPCAERVTFHNSGAEATFFALRIARAYRRRDKILKLEGAFHGMHDYALQSTQWTRAEPPYPQPVPSSHGIPKAVQDQVLVAPFNDLERTAGIIEAHHDELAAVIVEPLQRAYLPDPIFLPGLREVTRNYGIPLVFDEVVTGFRLGLGGAQERFGVTPDLCALGKTISGGLPIGVVAGREELMSLADPRRQLQLLPYVMLTGTFSSNRISTGVALAVIAELEKPGTYERMRDVGRRLMEGLESAMDEHDVEAYVTGDPTVFEVWFHDREPRDHRSAKGADFLRRMRFSDLLLGEGVLKAAEKFFVSAVHTDEDVEHTLRAFGRAAEQLGRGA